MQSAVHWNLHIKGDCLHVLIIRTGISDAPQKNRHGQFKDINLCSWILDIPRLTIQFSINRPSIRIEISMNIVTEYFLSGFPIIRPPFSVLVIEEILLLLTPEWRRPLVVVVAVPQRIQLYSNLEDWWEDLRVEGGDGCGCIVNGIFKVVTHYRSVVVSHYRKEVLLELNWLCSIIIAPGQFKPYSLHNR